MTMSVQGRTWLWRRVLDIVKEVAELTTLHHQPMAGQDSGAQPKLCVTTGKLVEEGPFAGEWFDNVIHPKPHSFERESRTSLRRKEQ